MLVAYDGTGFRGFAENDGVRTVGGELRRALETVLGEPVELSVAGRTDAGVHARGQVVSFDAATGLDPVRLRRSLLAMLAPEIAVRAIEPAPAGFHARFSACWRSYRYHLLCGDAPDPARSTTTWWVGEPLDLAAMGAAAELLVGEHDFAAFCRRPRSTSGEPVSLVRRVLAASWRARGDDFGELLRFDVVANAFCHQMVRSIVGTLVEVGRGRRRVVQVAEAVAGGDRSLAGMLAPPTGLSLWQVGYEAWVPATGGGGLAGSQSRSVG